MFSILTKNIDKNCLLSVNFFLLIIVFCHLVCSGPMMALCLAREDAVEGWREMLGPKEISGAAENAPDRFVYNMTLHW